MSSGDAASAPPGPSPSGTEKDLSDRIDLLEGAVASADNGTVTNARKMEALSGLEDFIPSLSRPEIVKQQPRLEDLCERVLAQSAPEPLRRLVVSVLQGVYRSGDISSLPTFVSRLLKLTGEQNKKLPTDTKVAALDVVGELVVLHGRMLEHFSNDIFVFVAKHMKLPEATARCSALQCLCKTISVAGIKNTTLASNIWKMLQKMLLDKAITVRTLAAHALSALVLASPACTSGAGANGDAMAVCCLKTLSADDQAGSSNALSSECRLAFAAALAQVLAAMATPTPPVPGDRPKKKPAVTDFASAVEFLEQAAFKGPPSGAAFVGFRAAICVASVRLADALGVADSASIALLMRALLGLLDVPSQGKTRSSSNTEDELLAQVARHLSVALRHLLLLADAQACLLEVIEQGLLPLVSAQIHETNRNVDTRMVVVLEALCCACVTAGEGFRSIETKVSRPLLHLVGNHPNPIVQLHATYCLRVVAHSSPPQLFQLMSVLLNLATVQNAELLGTPVPRRRDSSSAGSAAAAAPGHVSADLQTLLRGLFGHCAALAALNGELFHSNLGVPHDVTSAVLGTSRALLQPHPNATVSSQRRTCAFLLLEGLMCLGTDWVGQRLTTLFALWKTALGKKPVDRAKVLYQQHVAAAPSDAGGPDGAGACRDELLALLCALRSLYAFALHSHGTLLTSYSHLHKILVVFLTNISQLVVALPHPTNLRAKYRGEAAGPARPIITLSAHCGIPDILLMIRSTMYRTFAAMMPAQYSSRFVPLLNMLADDVTRPLPADFPVSEFLGQFLHPDDGPLDLVDSYTEGSKDGPATVRLAVTRLLSAAPVSRTPEGVSTELPKDLFTDAAASSCFSGAPREGQGGTEGLLTPWDAWFDPARPLAAQCTSAEWEWRCSAVSLLAIIMNASEVSEAPRAAVLLHLLKRKEPGEDGSNQHGKRGPPQQVVPSLAVLMYLREHVRTRGLKCAPPASPMEQVLQQSLEGVKDANPVVRRLHVELLSVLLYVHHQLPESPVVPSILQLATGESPAEGAPVRSAVALLCGAILRVFAWGGRQLSGGSKTPQKLHCPYIISIVPALLKLAKETTQPVRLWMLHAIHLSMQAAGAAFSPFLRDALRLATAHLLADFFASPLVLWALSELVHSAASMPLAQDDTDTGLREENVSRILGIWNELKHARYVGPGSSLAFATVRTEVLCISTANAVVKLAPLALNHLKDVFELVSAKLAPRRGGGGSHACTVRTAAARCLTDLVAPGLCLGQDGTIMQEPSHLFALLEDAQEPESQALRELVRALIRQRGLPQLPTWLQSLKEIVLALPPKGKQLAEKEEAAARAPEGEEGAKDEHDDGASMAGPKDAGADGKWHRAPHSSSKVFAVGCVQLLLEQADPEDAGHFQTEMPNPGDLSRPSVPQHRLVQHLETLVALAAHASSSDEESLAAAGLRLMLLIVQRFRRTRDVQGQVEVSNCPLLLVQFEAQMTACIRHNFRAESNPGVLVMALELLRDIIVARACNSTQRLIALLMQPFSNSAFEPDPLFCEFASTRTFLFRLRSACEILESDLGEQAVSPHLRDVARWIEHAVRDCAVLLAGLPLQSIKTYQPVCFSLADYKVVQPCFREALPTILRGVCALCNEQRMPSSMGPPAPDLVALSLGVVVLLLGDRSPDASEAEAKVLLRTIRQVLLHSSVSAAREGASGGAVVGVNYFLDLMGCVWRNIFKVPARCSMLLPELLELVHAVSGALFRRRRKGSAEPQVHTPSKRGAAAAAAAAAEATAAAGPPLEAAPWLEGLCADTEEGERSRSVVGAYSLHVAAAALRCTAVTEDTARVSRALDVFIWWLGDALPRSMESASVTQAEPEDDIVAAALQGEADPGSPVGAEAGGHCFWLWLLFLSPFPVDLMQVQAAITLKYWKAVCTILAAQPSSAQGSSYVANQLLYLALIANKLSKSLLLALDEGTGALTEAGERNVVCMFAMLVPVLTSLCAVLQQAAASARDALLPFSGNSRAVVNRCLGQTKEVFSRGLGHPNAKVVQTAVSSMQNLLQNSACTVLCPVLIPSLVLALISEPSTIPASTVTSAWSVISGMVSAQQQAGESSKLLDVTTPMVLKVVLQIVDYSKQRPGSFSAHTAAMAMCLVQVARIDPQGLKAEVSAMSSDGQQTIQQLMREHMSALQRGAGDPANAAGSATALTASKIELKMKF